MKFKIKFKFMALASVAMLTSCSWTARQADGMMDWANENMPTYDGSRPGAKTSSNSGLIPDNYNGYPYNSNAPRKAMNAPGISGRNATPPLPGMTAAQASSAAEGGNSRPNAYPTSTYNSAPPAFMSAPSAAASSEGRRAPSKQLPPSAIQPTAYGMHKPATQADVKQDDFPSEYNKSTPGMENFDSMIPPPPI